VANPKVKSEMSESEEKIDGSDYHIREMCDIKSLMMYYHGDRYIYIEAAP
jgi:hypothetical protein